MASPYHYKRFGPKEHRKDLGCLSWHLHEERNAIWWWHDLKRFQIVLLLFLYGIKLLNKKWTHAEQRNRKTIPTKLVESSAVFILLCFMRIKKKCELIRRPRHQVFDRGWLVWWLQPLVRQQQLLERGCEQMQISLGQKWILNVGWSPCHLQLVHFSGCVL